MPGRLCKAVEEDQILLVSQEMKSRTVASKLTECNVEISMEVSSTCFVDAPLSSSFLGCFP